MNSASFCRSRISRLFDVTASQHRADTTTKQIKRFFIRSRTIFFCEVPGYAFPRRPGTWINLLWLPGRPSSRKHPLSPLEIVPVVPVFAENKSRLAPPSQMRRNDSPHTAGQNHATQNPCSPLLVQGNGAMKGNKKHPDAYPPRPVAGPQPRTRPERCKAKAMRVKEHEKKPLPPARFSLL